MHDEPDVVTQVLCAQKSTQAADRLIRSYLPFIRSETSRFLKGKRVTDKDDELSVAMTAFYEAIMHYEKFRGAFFKYASLVIKRRLIDYARKEQRHQNKLSIDQPTNDESAGTIGDTLADPNQQTERYELVTATRQEITELSAQLSDFGISFSDISENCPKQARTLESCSRVLMYAKENPSLLEELLQTKRLPITALCAGTGVERKTLERHRKYLVALMVAFTNGYEIIRGHLSQVHRKKEASK